MRDKSSIFEGYLQPGGFLDISNAISYFLTSQEGPLVVLGVGDPVSRHL